MVNIKMAIHVLLGFGMVSGCCICSNTRGLVGNDRCGCVDLRWMARNLLRGMISSGDMWEISMNWQIVLGSDSWNFYVSRTLGLAVAIVTRCSVSTALPNSGEWSLVLTYCQFKFLVIHVFWLISRKSTGLICSNKMMACKWFRLAACTTSFWNGNVCV